MKRFSEDRKKFNLGFRLIFILVMISILTAALLGSRALVLGFSGSLLFLLFQSGILKLNKNALISSLIAFAGILLSLTWLFKIDSSKGRMLIYKISFNILREHWLTGIGLGNFRFFYREYQAEYFANEKYSIKELLLADNTGHAFNDYLQFTIEMGVPGIIILIIVVTGLYLTIIRALKENPKKPSILMLSCCILISILIAATVTHILERTIYQLCTLSALVIINYYAFNVKKATAIGTVVVINCLLIFMHFGKYYVKSDSYAAFKEAQLLQKTGSKLEALKIYQALYPELKQEAAFLNKYSSALLDLRYPKKAKNIIKELLLIDNSNLYYARLADCYFYLKEYNLAEINYTKAVNIVPNRFITRFKLFEFYCNTSQQYKALETCLSALAIPVKVSSPEIDAIRTKMKHFLIKK